MTRTVTRLGRGVPRQLGVAGLPTTARPADAQLAEGLRRALEIVAAILGPITALTALLYYFGWVRTGAFFGHFGIEPNLLGYTTEDYLLRSAGVAFRPTAAIILVGILAIGGHRLLARFIPTGALARRGLLATIAAAGLALAAYGFAVLFGVVATADALWDAAALVTGLLLLESATSVWTTGADRLSVAFRRILIGAGVVVACFWAFAAFAQRSGEVLAASWSAHLADRPLVTVYSKDDLQLQGPGVNASQLTESGDGFRYRYTGLRMLIFSNGRWFLLPDQWRTDNGATAIVMQDGDRLRVEVTAPGGAP